MADKKDDKKAQGDANAKKPKVAQTDKYYKIKADFGYLSAYNYKITKEIGRGGYGVVYKVILFFTQAVSLTGGTDQEYAIKINFNTVSR